MSLVAVVLGSAVILGVAYVTYGSLLARLFRLDPNATTPAVAERDGVDYEPIEKRFLLSQHFSAIAAAGPIVGPIIAGVTFGWAPALAWILIGSILIGGVHDLSSLMASIRHRARSIAEVVRDQVSRRSYLLFLSFVWIALIYIIIAFTDITAEAFIGERTLDSGQVVLGGGIATSSMLYLILPIIMGLLLRYTRLTVGWATLIFVPLVGVAIWAGQQAPFNVDAIVRAYNPALSIEESQMVAHKIWDVALLAYCLVAAATPMWLLLQPRGHLGGVFLYAALLGGAVGLLLSGQTIQYPALITSGVANQPMFPFLFILIACGACSGFHSLVASGTTSKQLRTETDAKLVGYGAMLLEGMVAVVSLACVMIVAQNSPIAQNPKPDQIYAMGIGRFLSVFGVAPEWGVAFAFMAFATFVYDTLDVCTRLGRYIVQELTGWRGRMGRWFATGITAGTPLFFILRTTGTPGEAAQPLWKAFWPLFGASNQLLAALTLLGVTIWLWRTRRAPWVLIVTGIPTVWMYVMSLWALSVMTLPHFYDGGITLPRDPVPWAGMVLIGLAILMLLEALWVMFGPRASDPSPTYTSEGIGHGAADPAAA